MTDRTLYIVTEFDYIKCGRGSDSDSAIMFLSFDFDEAKATAEECVACYMGKDNMNVTVGENNFSASFNYEYGGGTMIIAVEEVKSKDDLVHYARNKDTRKSMKEFLTKHEFMVPAGMKMDAFMASVIAMKDQTEGYRERVAALLVGSSRKKKTATTTSTNTEAESASAHHNKKSRVN